MSGLKVQSRAVAAYICLVSGVEVVPEANHFVLVDEDSAGEGVSAKSLWQWEREFQESPYAVFNQLLRNLGDAQRAMKHSTFGESHG